VLWGGAGFSHLARGSWVGVCLRNVARLGTSPEEQNINNALVAMGCFQFCSTMPTKIPECPVHAGLVLFRRVAEAHLLPHFRE